MNVLRYIAFGLMILACVVALSVCGDGLGACCDHLCCTGVERSRSVQRVLRRLRSLWTGTLAVVLPVVESALAAGDRAPNVPSSSAIAKVAALRI